MSSLLVAANGGASLAFSSSDNKIYALAGGGTQDFLSYDPNTDSWTSLPPANIPNTVGPGGSLTFDNFNGRFYAFVGGEAADFYEYTVPPSDSWSKWVDFPPGYPRPITIEILDYVDNSLRFIEGLTDFASYNFAFTYDGTIELDGHIPQDGSGYVSGIGLGTYKVRVWVNEYIQPEDAIVTFTNNLAATRIEFDVHRMGRAEILVHFKDCVQGQLAPVIRGGSLAVALYDSDGIVRGRNSTLVTSGSTSSSVIVTGFLGTRQDLGLPQGTYYVIATIEGFYQPSDFFITISDCSAISKASFDVFRTGTLNLTIRSVNCQSPPQPQDWLYPDSTIRVEVRDLQGAILYKTVTTRQVRSRSEATVFATGLRAGTYLLRISTFGYFEKTSYVVAIVDCATVDRTVDLVVGGAIDVNVLLEKEDLPHWIDTYWYSYRVPIRIEVYDSTNQFVAANATYMYSGMTQSTFRLIGFRRYAGDAAYRWVNFYDTTGGSIQRDYGLGPGTYRVLVYVPGYLQDSVAADVRLTECSRASITLRLDRLAHLSGTVTSLNMFGEVVPLNWAIVDAIGSNTKDFAPTMDGSYDMWLPDGRYLVICSLSGYEFSTKEVPLSKGSDVAIDFRLRYVAINIPEFGDVASNAAAVLTLVCVASILISRRFGNRGHHLKGSQANHKANSPAAL
jgi:hypothetical protein